MNKYIYNKSSKINDIEIVSLGNYCLTSMILKENNLKNNSFPFDWMVSCINNINHCISNNFTEFLNLNNYEYLNSKTKNTYYFKNTEKLFKKLNCNHQHHNFKNKLHYEYIERCVYRFNNLNKCKKVIFVMIQPLYINNIKTNKEEVIKLYKTLINKFNKTKVILLIFNITKINNIVYNETKINNNCYIYELKTKISKGKYGMIWYDKQGIDQFLKIIKSF